MARPILISAATAVVALAAVASNGAAAQDRGAVFTGVEVGRDWFAYAGALVGPNEGGWAVRGVAAAGQYDYSSGGVDIDGEYRQAELALVRQSSGSWGYLNLGAGARFTDTELTPDDPGNDRRGSQWDALVTIDGVRRSGLWETGGYAAYGIDMREYYVRARATRQVGSERFRLGVEGVVQGDPNFDRQGAAFVAIHRTGGMDWTATLGARGGEAHVSVGLVRSF